MPISTPSNWRPARARKCWSASKTATCRRVLAAGTLLYLRDDHYWVFDLTTGAHTNITKAVASSFVDKQSDETVKQKPGFGVAGWTTGDAAVWSVRPDRHLVDRAGRVARPAVDRRRARPGPPPLRAAWTPMSMSSTPRHRRSSRCSGCGRSNPVMPACRQTVRRRSSTVRCSRRRRSTAWSRPTQRRVCLREQAFDDSPDLFVGDAALAGAKQVSETNPFQSRYAWGRTELVEYKSDKRRAPAGRVALSSRFRAGPQVPDGRLHV